MTIIVAGIRRVSGPCPRCNSWLFGVSSVSSFFFTQLRPCTSFTLAYITILESKPPTRWVIFLKTTPLFTSTRPRSLDAHAGPKWDPTYDAKCCLPGYGNDIMKYHRTPKNHEHSKYHNNNAKQNQCNNICHNSSTTKIKQQSVKYSQQFGCSEPQGGPNHKQGWS